MARPLLLTAPWRRAVLSLRHRPALLATAAATGLIIGLVASAPVLFVSSVGGGAVQKQYSLACPASTGITMTVPQFHIVDGVYQPRGPSLDLLQQAVNHDPTFAVPVRIEASYSPTPVSAGDNEAAIGFLVRPGWRDHVEMLSAEVPGDVWIPDTIATPLGVGPGDTIVVHGRGDDQPLVVAGVFRDIAAEPLDGFWCAAVNAILPRNMFGEVFPPPMAVVEKDTFDERYLRDSLYFERYVAEFAHAPLTVHEADADVRAAEAVSARLEAIDPDATAYTGIDRLGARAHMVRSAVRDTTMPVAALAVVCALSLASVLGLLWVRARRNSCIALATVGVAPVAIGLKAALETGLAVVVGAGGGAFLARASMAAWAPATDLEPGTFTWGLVAAGTAAIVGLLLVGATAALSCRSLLRHAAPIKRSWLRFVPFELSFAAVAWWAARSLGHEALVPIEGQRVVDTSAAVLLLPLSMLALGAALTARVWWLLTRRRRSGEVPSRLPRRLALRRLQFGSKAGTAILGAGTLALGVSVFGLAMNTSLERTGVAKSSVFVGSDVSVLIAGTLPADVPGATEVWVREEMTYGGEPVDLIAVDPASFAQAAFWDDAFADQSLGALIDEVAAGVDDGGLRVIAIGDVPITGEILNPKHPAEPWAAHVVAHARSFPGTSVKRPALVMALPAAQKGPINFFHFVWAKGDYGHWRPILQDDGARPMLGVSRQDAVDSSVLKFAAWSFDFVKALGVFVGALVVAALLLHLAVRQRQQALGFAFLRRMGFTHRRHWRALVMEVGAMMAAVVVLGSSLALLCVRIISPHVDPLPIVPPTPLMVVPWVALAVVGAIAVAVVTVGSAIAQWSGSRVDVAEVLRDGT